MQHVCPLQQTEPGPFGVSGHRRLQRRALARFTGQGLDWER